MRRAGLLILVLLPSAGGCAAPAVPAARRVPIEHVVMISIDGLRPDFYLGDWDAPVLKGLASRGAHARRVESVYPSATYPAHATLVTGVRPARHGIHANTVWAPEGGSTRDWHWFAKDLKSRTLWQAARERGLKAAITYWPSSVGAEAEWVLGEIWDPENKDTVKRLVRAASPGLLMGLALSVGVPAERIVEDREAVDDFVSLAAARIFRVNRPHLQLVHLIQVDDVQHRHGPDAPEVREALRRQDANVGRILEAVQASGVGDRTVVLVVGDHGFTSVERNLNPNALLRDAGFIESSGDRIVSWRARVRSSGGSAAVYVKDRREEAEVRRVLESGAVRDGARLYRVFGRDELDPLGYNPEAVFALEPEPGWAVVERLAPDLVHGLPTVKGNHGQRPERPGLHTGFLAAGPGIRPGVAVDWMHLVDVAPTVASMLGLDLPGVEGRDLGPVLLR
jgi:predicted AlkP superfamily pyrophosphatase or phosphodiesterase